MKAESAEELIDRVGRRIAEIRRAKGLTQAEVAEQLDTDVANFRRIELGVQNVTVRMLARVAAILEVRVVRLFEPLDDPRRKRQRGRPRLPTKG